jgi:hypothetical protein
VPSPRRGGPGQVEHGRVGRQRIEHAFARQAASISSCRALAQPNKPRWPPARAEAQLQPMKPPANGGR